MAAQADQRVEFVRRTADGRGINWAGNRVQIEGADGESLGVGNPAPIEIIEGGVVVSNINPLPTRRTIIRSSVIPVISNGVAYAAGDALGNMLVFTNISPITGGKGIITKVVITDEDQQDAPVDIIFFPQNFTATADNDVFGLSDADLQNSIGYIDVAATDYSDFANNSMATKTSGLRMPFEFSLSAGIDDLRAQMVIREAATYGAVDAVQVALTIEVHS